MPAKKAPAKKAAPTKKSGKNVARKNSPRKKAKSSDLVTFTLSVKPPYSVNIKKAGNTSSYRGNINLQSGDVVVMKSIPQSAGSPGNSSGNSDVSAIDDGSKRVGFGYNMPPTQGGKVKIMTDLSIFDKMERTNSGNNLLFKKTKEGLTLFTIGIEG